MLSETFRDRPVATLSPLKKHCFACANVLDVRAELCPRCGVRQPQLELARGSAARLAPASKSKVVAVLLALFLGGIGIHKFYLGQIAAGVVYLVFCWTLIPGVIALVELIVMLAMSDEAFARRYPA